MWTVIRLAIVLAVFICYSIVCYEIGKLRQRRKTKKQVIYNKLRPYIRQNIRSIHQHLNCRCTSMKPVDSKEVKNKK